LMLSEKFQIQEGKFFLTRAVFGNMDEIKNIAQKRVNELIASL